MNNNLKEFLIRGNMFQMPCWNKQLEYFFFTFFFLAIQLLPLFLSGDVRRWILLGICLCIEIVLLTICKLREKRMYANVYNGFIQLSIWMILCWIDGWCMISLVVNGTRFVVYCMLGTVLFVIWILWRIQSCKKKIERNHYHKISVIESPVVAVGSVGVGSFVIASNLLRGIKMSNELAFFIMAFLFWGLSILFSLCTDLGVRAYYFSKLSEEEQRMIVTIKP